MELIKVTRNEDGSVAVSGRELHEYLEITERYNSWISRMMQYGFEEKVDYLGCKIFNSLARKEIDEHILSLDMAKEISMIQRNEKGKEARKYFIEVEKKFREQAQVPMSIEDMMIHQLQETKKMKQQITTIETTLETLPLQVAECDRVSLAVKKKAFEFTGDKGTNVYDKCYDKTVKNIYSQIKYHFGVRSYKQIERNKLIEALDFINELKIPRKLKDEIEVAKTQARLELSEENE